MYAYWIPRPNTPALPPPDLTSWGLNLHFVSLADWLPDPLPAFRESPGVQTFLDSARRQAQALLAEKPARLILVFDPWAALIFAGHPGLVFHWDEALEPNPSVTEELPGVFARRRMQYQTLLAAAAVTVDTGDTREALWRRLSRRVSPLVVDELQRRKVWLQVLQGRAPFLNASASWAQRRVMAAWKKTAAERKAGSAPVFSALAQSLPQVSTLLVGPVPAETAAFTAAGLPFDVLEFRHPEYILVPPNCWDQVVFLDGPARCAHPDLAVLELARVARFRLILGFSAEDQAVSTADLKARLGALVPAAQIRLEGTETLALAFVDLNKEASSAVVA